MTPQRGLDVTWVSTTQLRENKRNPRKHPRAQIKKVSLSIKEFGFTNPILVDEHLVVIAGHGRLEAARSLGMASVPVIQLDGLTKAQKLALMVADNKIALDASWDVELLTDILGELALPELDFDVTITGFETAELDILFGATAPRPEDTIEEPDPNAPVLSRPGDVWILGSHRLICGDALRSATYDALMGDELAQMVITDPPYNVPINGFVTSSGRHDEFQMASGEMTRPEFTRFLTTAFTLIAEVSAAGAIAFTFMDWRHMREILEAGDAAFTSLINVCVWNKTNGGMGSFYRSKHELVFVHNVSSGPRLNNVELGRNGRYRTNVWDYAGVNTFREGRAEDLGDHPTVKPVAMIADAILDCSKRRGLVLDPFAGSGTTILAAESTGRRARCAELDPRYVDVAIRRWIKLTGKQPILEATGENFADLIERRAIERTPSDAE